MMKYLFITLFFLSGLAQAQDKKHSGETEASAVVISGNADSETYSAKTKNSYAVSENDLGTIFGKYIRVISSNEEIAKSWQAGLRYDRVLLKDVFNVFVQHEVEHDPYNGIFIQRNSTDVGVKYTFEKTDYWDWFGEFGYRYSKTYVNMEAGSEYSDFLRLYTEAEYKISPTSSAKIWIEHLPNLKNPKQSQSNAEASLSVAINSVFSLKTSYLVNRNEAIEPPDKKDTITWTTALVAKY